MKFRSIAANTLVAGMLFSTCGVSTYRGLRGMITEDLSVSAMKKEIVSMKLAPDCLQDQYEVAKAMAPFLGLESAVKISEEMLKHVSRYTQESAKASTEDDKETAAGKLARSLHEAVEHYAQSNATLSQRLDAVYTFITMVGLRADSADAALKAVHGSLVVQAVENLTNACFEPVEVAADFNP